MLLKQRTSSTAPASAPANEFKPLSHPAQTQSKLWPALLALSLVFILLCKLYIVSPLEAQNQALQAQLEEVSAYLLAQDKPGLEIKLLETELKLKALQNKAPVVVAAAPEDFQLEYDRKEAVRTRRRLVEYARDLCVLERSLLVEIKTSEGDMEVQLAPCELTPVVTMYIVNKVKQGFWDGMTFFRAESHVVQATTRYVNGSYPKSANKFADEIPFPEYSSEFPHKKFTLGLAGRPGGTDFYINMVDNVRNHGPGGQTYKGYPQSADACFGVITKGQDVAVRIQQLPYHKQGGLHILRQPVEILKMAFK